MQAARRCTLTFMLLCMLGSTSSSQVSPVSKVSQLLGGMLERAKKEKHGEQVQFAAYKQFCDDTASKKKNSISESEELMDTLKSDIQKYAAKVELLTEEIQELQEDESVWTGDIKAASKVRQIDKIDYDKTHKDYSESLDALQRAILVLKKQSHDRKQATSSLLQFSALSSLHLIPPETKQALESFMQHGEAGTGSEELDGAPEANAYEFQSSGVVDMLENLKDKFIDERTKLEKEEQNSRQAFELLMQDLKAQIKEAKKDSSEKTTTKAKSLQSKADKEGDLKDTVNSMNEDKKYLSKLVSTCRQKASDFESRQNMRAEEITAIEKAIAIISGEKVAGAADKHLGLLVQTPLSSFPQLRAERTSVAQAKVATYLHKQAQLHKSQMLEILASRASADPFKKVQKMLKDLVVRLMEEANEEAEHKGWCDKELKTNTQTRKTKAEAVESLQAEIDELNASIAKLTDTIGDKASTGRESKKC
jgi:histone H3/H4